MLLLTNVFVYLLKINLMGFTTVKSNQKKNEKKVFKKFICKL